MSNDLAKAERDLRQAQRILAHGRPDRAEEWLLVATLIGEADLVFQDVRRRDPSPRFPLLDTVIEGLYEMTSGFTDPEFLRSTRPGRRRNLALFRAGL